MANDTGRTRTPRKAAPALTATPATPRRRVRPRAAEAVLEGVVVGKAETVVPKADTIEFLGRTMRVKMVAPEQLVVWRRLANRLQGAEGAAEMDETPRDGETREQARARVSDYGMTQLDRMLKVVGSVLLDRVDRDWVEDQLLEGTVRLTTTGDIPGVADIISLTVDHFTASSRAEAASTTGPQPKARRRA